MFARTLGPSTAINCIIKQTLSQFLAPELSLNPHSAPERRGGLRFRVGYLKSSHHHSLRRTVVARDNTARLKPGCPQGAPRSRIFHLGTSGHSTSVRVE